MLLFASFVKDNSLCIVFRILWKMGFWEFKQSATIWWHLPFSLQQQSHWVLSLAFLQTMNQIPS